MTKFNKLQNSFTAGELSPKLRGRTELKEYYAGAETLENLLPLPSGGVVRRPGTRHIMQLPTTPYATHPDAIIIPFQYSASEIYWIFIVRTLVTTITYTIFSAGGSSPITNGTLSAATTDVAGNDYDDINGWNYAQIGDVLFVTHSSGNFQPQCFKRTAASTFTVSTYTSCFYTTDLLKTLAQPFRDINLTAVTLTPSATTGADITITASSATFDITRSVGTYYKIANDALTDEGIVVLIANAANSTTVFHATVLVTLPGTGGYKYWKEGYFSDRRGYPRTVEVFEQRLIFGGSRDFPDTLFFSRAGNVFQLTQEQLYDEDAAGDTNLSGLNWYGGTDDTAPFNITIASNEVNAVTFLSSYRELIVGTLGSEYTITSDVFLSKSDIKIRKHTSFGSLAVKPATVNSSIYFISRDGRKLRDFKFNDTNGSFVSNDISALNDTILFHGATSDYYNTQINQIVFQASRGLIWVVTSKGALLALTIGEEFGVLGWSKHTLGGTAPFVMSISVYNRADNNYEDLYILVRRTINSAYYYSIEKIGPDFEHTALYNDETSEDEKPYFSDSAVRVLGASVPMTTEDGEVLTTEAEEVIIL